MLRNSRFWISMSLFIGHIHDTNKKIKKIKNSNKFETNRNQQINRWCLDLIPGCVSLIHLICICICSCGTDETWNHEIQKFGQKAKNQKKRKSMNFQCILENSIRGKLFFKMAFYDPKRTAYRRYGRFL